MQITTPSTLGARLPLYAAQLALSISVFGDAKATSPEQSGPAAPVVLEHDGKLSIEAEDFHSQTTSRYENYDHPHEWVKARRLPGYSGSGYVQVLPDERGESGAGPPSPRDKSGAMMGYRCWISRPGIYRVFVRGMAMGGESNGLHVGLEDREFTRSSGASNMSGFRPAGRWTWEHHRKHGYESPATVDLDRGLQTICIWNRDDGFCLDKVDFLHADLEASSSRTTTGFGEQVRRTNAVSVAGNRFLVNGQPRRLWGVRVASGAVSASSTDGLLKQLRNYKAHGINAITLFYMGSSGGHLDPFVSDGAAFRDGQGIAVRDRMDSIIKACDDLGIVVVVGIFYQWKETSLSERHLADWDAARRATQTVSEHLAGLPHRNVILNIANEQGSEAYRDEPWGRVRNVEDLLSLVSVAKRAAPDLIVGAGGYDHENNVRLGQSREVDILLFDTLGPDRQEHSAHWHDRFVDNGITKPMVNVEIFGAWTSQFTPPGVYPRSAKEAHYKEIDEALERPSLHVFFHSNPWFQGPSIGERLRFDLGGQGTETDPGVRWFFDRVVKNSGQPGSPQIGSATNHAGGQ